MQLLMHIELTGHTLDYFRVLDSGLSFLAAPKLKYTSPEVLEICMQIQQQDLSSRLYRY